MHREVKTRTILPLHILNEDEFHIVVQTGTFLGVTLKYDIAGGL